MYVLPQGVMSCQVILSIPCDHLSLNRTAL